MRCTLLLATCITLTQCEITDVGTEINGFFYGDNNRDIQQAKPNVEKSKRYISNVERSIFRINSERGNRRILSQNDIVLTKKRAKQLFNRNLRGARSKRQVLKQETYPNSTWNDGVFYAFNTSDELLQTLFKKGAKVWSDVTCIDFVEDNNASDKVVVVKEPEIFSSIGRLGGDQTLSLDEGYVTIGTAVHEIGHVLGFFHTMQRTDRDSFIKIVKQKLDRRHIKDFVRVRSSDANVYGMTYDYGSIMHYDELSGSISNETVMIATEPHYQKTMGSELISFSDIFMINEHYGCNARCNKSTSANCANEGFPHPRNCSICICPGGYGGTLCDRRPPGCGEDLGAISEKRTVIYRLGFGSDLRDQFIFCNYMITAPEGKKIEVDVRSISLGYDRGGCPRGGVEIKAQKDQKLTGYRFCSVKGSEGPIVSSSNRLPVILFNRLGVMQIVFTYRYID